MLYLYTGAMMIDLTDEEYHKVPPKWNGLALT